MADIAHVIVGTLVTEKSERLKANESSYTFRVAGRATRVDVRRAVEKMFKVHVARVRVMVVRGKFRRMGQFRGQRPDWKKAVVVLKKGETIEALER